jgi:hypothetical protein
MSEEQLRDKLQAAALEGAVNGVFAKSGVKMTKLTRSYVESALSCEIRTGDSPVISITDPEGRTFASTDEFAEALAHDPDFATSPAQSSSGGNSAQPRQVRVEDLAEHLDKQRVPLEDVANGSVRVVFPEPANRELEANEVSAHDQRQLSANLDDIASGKKKVVFAGRA